MAKQIMGLGKVWFKLSRRITVNVDTGSSYDIVFDNQFIELSEELKRLALTGKKTCMITDDMVAPLYADQIKEILEQAGNCVSVFTFPHGETSKTLETVQHIYETLIREKLERSDFLVALGGGVTGDITGFCAATYLRGISFIQIPTTLLAQVDSSIGGKTGVDFKQYKNMVGAFKMPLLVYANLNVLATLEERQYFSGFAEVMKAALLKDSIFYEWLIENMYEICDRDMAVLEEMVYRSCNIKKMIVEKDPYEKGERALLNLGHTIGHAIEKYRNFELLHGECVALGCVAAAYISWKKEMLTMEEYYEIRDMFVPFNLPISIDDIDIEQLLQNTRNDKKMENNHIKFVLLKKIGKAVVDKTVSDDEIRNALKEIQYIEDNE